MPRKLFSLKSSIDKETLELISRKKYYKSIQKGKNEIRTGVKGKSLSND